MNKIKFRGSIPGPVSERMVGAGAAVAVFHWSPESVIQGFRYGKSRFISQIFPRVTNGLWMRSLILLTTLSFNQYARLIFSRPIKKKVAGNTLVFR